MRRVEYALVAGIRVNRSHKALLDAAQFVNNFCHRRQAIRRAGGVRNNLMACFYLFVINAINHCNISIFSGRGNENTVGASRQMSGGLLPLGKKAGAFKDHIDAQIPPRQMGRVAL